VSVGTGKVWEPDLSVETYLPVVHPQVPGRLNPGADVMMLCAQACPSHGADD
jgi:hypothetical protein